MLRDLLLVMLRDLLLVVLRDLSSNQVLNTEVQPSGLTGSFFRHLMRPLSIGRLRVDMREV